MAECQMVHASLMSLHFHSWFEIQHTVVVILRPVINNRFWRIRVDDYDPISKYKTYL